VLAPWQLTTLRALWAALPLLQQATALEAQAQEAQANVLAMVQEAVGPEQVRCGCVSMWGGWVMRMWIAATHQLLA
jgi:lipase chaperone LimK